MPVAKKKKKKAKKEAEHKNLWQKYEERRNHWAIDTHEVPT